MSSSVHSARTAAPLGAVLAGGRSRRLGRDKAGEMIGGASLLQRAVATLSEVLEEVVVVGPADDAVLIARVETVPDLVRGRGPLGGLHAALDRAGGRAIFALACDLPFAGPELVRHLLSRAVVEARAACVVPRWRGRLQPLCGLYAPSCLPLIEERLARDRLAVHGLLQDLEVVEVAVGPELPFHHPELLLNVNRAEDVDLARRIAAGLGAEDARG